jgi:hypothetical protein
MVGHYLNMGRVSELHELFDRLEDKSHAETQ